MVGGLIRGTKHWPFNAVNAMWDWLIPLLRGTFAKVFNQTVKTWQRAIQYAVIDRDPRRLYRLINLLLDFTLRFVRGGG